MATRAFVDSIAKITDFELRSFAEDDTTQSLRSVIVEVRPTALGLKRDSLTDHFRDPGKRFEIQYGPLSGASEKDALDRLEAELRALGLFDAVRLNAASAFVVDVSPAQLRAISLLPQVGVIRPNRTHHAPMSRS